MTDISMPSDLVPNAGTGPLLDEKHSSSSIGDTGTGTGTGIGTGIGIGAGTGPQSVDSHIQSSIAEVDTNAIKMKTAAELDAADGTEATGGGNDDGVESGTTAAAGPGAAAAASASASAKSTGTQDDTADVAVPMSNVPRLDDIVVRQIAEAFHGKLFFV
jgi:hypothetical protein